MQVKFAVETPVSNSLRARQVCSMFDAPPEKKARIEFDIELDLDTPWNVGLIVGPSGSGKSSVMRQVWGEPPELQWGTTGVVDDFDKSKSVEDVSAICQAVGFNTIPAWLRPYQVLSNGEKFRVDLARRMLETPGTIVVDEFTSVVDRQVAKIGSHAVQKHVRRGDRQFIAVSCHYDIIDWLQPDWVLDMATRQFQRRLLQRRPSVECVVGRLPHSAWPLFAPFHYLTAKLNRSARCFGLWLEGRLASFVAVLPVPTTRGCPIYRVSRVVTLPDYQGLGLAMVLTEAVGSEYKALGYSFRNYPAHAAYIRSLSRSGHWKMVKAGGRLRTRTAASLGYGCNTNGSACAVFEYVGPAATEPRLGLPTHQNLVAPKQTR